MALLDFFRRRPAIAGISELADFLDSRSAFMVQNYVLEYSHARPGLLSAADIPALVGDRVARSEAEAGDG